MSARDFSIFIFVYKFVRQLFGRCSLAACPALLICLAINRLQLQLQLSSAGRPPHFPWLTPFLAAALTLNPLAPVADPKTFATCRPLLSFQRERERGREEKNNPESRGGKYRGKLQQLNTGRAKTLRRRGGSGSTERNSWLLLLFFGS